MPLQKQDQQKHIKMESKSFSVEGMMCGGCAATVEKAALSISGVGTAFVSLESHSLTIEYDPAIASPASVADAVRAAGFECSL